MSNLVFKEKIASFFPVNKNFQKDFYFEFSQLPTPDSITFDFSITAFNPNVPYQLHLTVNKDNYNQNSQIINMYLQKNSATLRLNPSDKIDSDLSSADFTIKTETFQVDNGIHTYIAQIELIDMNGKKLDSNKTWFITRNSHQHPQEMQQEELKQRQTRR